MAGPIEVLRADRQAAVAFSQEAGRRRLKGLLRRAQTDLDQRLRRAEGLSGPGKDSFTAAQLRATLAQVTTIQHQLAAGLKGLLVDEAGVAVDPAVAGTVAYLKAMEAKFQGLHAPLPIREAALLDRAHQGSTSSLLHQLESDPKRGPGVLARYGDAVVQRFEERLQERFLARQPWEQVRNALIADSPFLQQAPAHWAERIVRTELMGVHNRAIWEANRAVDKMLPGGVVKILCATFDNRTGSDSIAVHGQIRRPDQAFAWWEGLYQHPPNRPNDREVVVTHRVVWPIPDELKARPDSEVAARWALEGRKGAPPPRPKMTTVPLESFGQPADEPAEEHAPEPAPPVTTFVPPKPPARPIVEPPPLPPRVTRAPIASPFFEGELHAPFDEPAPPLTAADVMHASAGAQQGSNPGGFYRGTDNVLRYVKLYADPVQAHVENLTNRIYKDLGLASVESTTFETPDGKVAYASEVVPGKTLKDKGLDDKLAKRVMKGFVGDVLVGNWDAVGLNLDNALVTKGGKVLRVDNGGALLFRAQGTRKPGAALFKIDEWEGLLNPSVNPAYARVAKAAGVERAEDIAGVRAQIRDVLALRDQAGGWRAYVDKHAAGMPEMERGIVADMLEARTDLLKAKLKRTLPKRAVEVGRDFDPSKLPVMKRLPETPDAPRGWKGSLRQFHVEVEDKLDALQKEDQRSYVAMRQYTGSFYDEIRNTRRLTPEKWMAKHGGDLPSYEAYARQYADLDRAFDKAAAAAKKGDVGGLARTPERHLTELMRGIKNLSEEEARAILGDSHYTSEAILSTSWDPEVALSFADGSFNKWAIVFHFKMKPEPATKLAVETRSASGRREREVVVREGVRFKKKAVHKLTVGGHPNRYVVEMEEL